MSGTVLHGTTLIGEGHAEDLPDRGDLSWRVLLAAWSIAAVISALQVFASYAIRDALGTTWPLVVVKGVKVLSWALVTRPILRLGRRHPVERGRYLRNGTILLAMALIFSGAFEYLWIKMALLFSALTGNPMVSTISARDVTLNQLTAIFSGTIGDCFIFIAILGVGAAIDRNQRLRERDAVAAQLETQLALAQVQALKRLIHPHFLFNALHAVTVLIDETPAVATEMVVRLGALLRLSLARAASAEVPLQSELELVRLYVDIEQLRFQDRLAVRYEVAPETERALVPDMLLQPLVENAIKHGISAHEEAGIIEIRAGREGPHLVIEVWDNGPGVSPTAQISEGVGHVTTRARLAALYATDHEFTVAAAPGGGTVARLSLPFHTVSEAIKPTASTWSAPVAAPPHA